MDRAMPLIFRIGSKQFFATLEPSWLEEKVANSNVTLFRKCGLVARTVKCRLSTLTGNTTHHSINLEHLHKGINA
jgi:hypothetical protein